MAQFQTTARSDRALVLSAFMRGVYGWMSLGLGLTALVAALTLGSNTAMSMLLSVEAGRVVGLSGLYFVLVIAEFGLVIALSAAIGRLSGATASLLFLLYSALNGVTISVVLAMYTQASVASTFLICAGMFGAMSVYGLVTGKDLTSWGSFLMMGLFGIILAMFANMFIQSAKFDLGIAIIGVIVFVGLTAYDTQKLKIMGESAPYDDATAVQRGSILGALTLYLDFINLFLMLLRLFGSRRD